LSMPMRYWNSFKTNMSDFGKFLYDSETKTVMGRDSSSWFRISLFYLGYYMFLAGLFAASISITLGTLDDRVPYFQTRLQYPGLMVLPKTKKTDPLTLDVRFNKGNSDSYKMYVDGLDDLMSKQYNPALQTNDTFYQACDSSYPSNVQQNYDKNSFAKACRFNSTQFGNCGSSPYGYKDGKPCILLKLNRIINWKPVAFSSLTDSRATAAGSPSKAPSLSASLKARNQSYNRDLIYAACYGMDEENQKLLTGRTGEGDTIKYSPQGIQFSYFPYLGLKLHPNYVSPAISVQFTNVTLNKEIKVGCKVYARNLVDLARINVGYINFKMQIDG